MMTSHLFGLVLSGAILQSPATPPTAPAPATPTTPPATTSPAQDPAQEREFKQIFDGATLAGWVGDTAGYAVEDGAITCTPKGTNLFTDGVYGDFVLRLEFRLDPGANNGIGIRAPLEGDAAFEGMELQVLDNSSPKYASLKPWQFHGSIYGVVPAKREFLKPVGEWNQQEILAQGSHIKVTLNGTVIVDADIAKAATDGTIDGKPHPGLRRQAGHIGFLGHGDKVSYRNIRIRELH